MMHVLLIKLSSMGDVLHTLPALTDAAKAIPGIKFTWVVEEGFQEIPRWHPAVTQVIPVALRKRKFKQIFSALSTIRAQKYDLVLDAQGLIKSAVLARLARNTKIAGLDHNSARESVASWFYSHKYLVAKNQHAVQRVRQLFAQSLNYSLADLPVVYGLDSSNFAEPLHKCEMPYLMFLHGTTWESKHWPDQYWLELARIAGKNGYKVQVTWATAEQKSRAQTLADKCSNVIMLPHLNLNQAAATLQYAAGAVAVDTGFAHLTAALEKPLVAIYGATDVTKAGTMGSNNINLASKFSCAPCGRRKCTLVSPGELQPPCMREMTPKVVWDRLYELITGKI